MRLLLVGDTHGNDRFFAQMCKAAVDQNCQAILQLGDFGYWEHYPQGAGFLKWCQRKLAEAGLECYWLDGNHENHPLLWSTYGPGGNKHKPTKEGFWQIRSNLFYLPRGHRWTWDGVDFLALGGAYSIDKEWRKEGSSWWPTEMITDEDVQTASAGGKADVIVSHDCPVSVDIPSIQGYRLYPESSINRQKLEEVVKATRPYFLVHGHYHDRYSSRLTLPVGVSEDGKELLWHNTQIEGVGADMSSFSDSHLVFDTELFNASRPDR